MKKIIYLMLLLPLVAIGQSTNQNYTKVVTYKEATSTTLPTPTSSQASIQVAYYDGLGRPIQQISNKQSNTGKNIVTHIEYDPYGRQVKEYLPYKSESTGLEIETNTLSNTLNYPDYLSQNPFSEKLLEASPVSTILKQAAPGTDWVMGDGHEVKFQYQTNVANEVKLYKATATWSSADIQFVNASGSSYYNPNELYKTITYDENNPESSQNFTVEFKDKEGKVILKRVSTNEGFFDTHYVYDQFGNLTYVIPPLANTNTTITPTVLNGLCYQYKYDSRNRLVEKKLPGKQWEFIVYNTLNQVVASGPVNHPITGTAVGWIITKYDIFGRVTLTGWYNGLPASSNGRFAYQNIMNIITSPYEERLTSPAVTTINDLQVSYTDKVYPICIQNPYTLLTVNYYDDYSYDAAPSSIPTSIDEQIVNTFVKGLQTGSWVRILQTGATIGERSYTLYDPKSRVIRTNKTNYLGGFTEVDSQYDFVGKTKQTITKHKRLSTSILLTIKDAFTYTPQDRLLTHTHQINGYAIQLLAKNEYDELGQLIVKRVGGTDVTGSTSLQKVDYSYNIRGWLKGINDTNNLSVSGDPQDLFAFKLNYNQVEDENGYTGVKLYNGNIAETYWRTANDNKIRKYGYQYDNLNRLINAVYQKPNSAVVVTNSYNESITYDKNGNITNLQRYGEYDDDYTPLLIDNLIYNYDSTQSNQLAEVIDDSINPNGYKDGAEAGNDYSYDANGNMVHDGNKNIDVITYNHLNLPRTINFADGNYIAYIYDAVGVKVRKQIMNGEVHTTTDYLDGFQYVDEVLEVFPHSEGYVKNNMLDNFHKFNYAFNYTDHLGNIRVTYGIDPFDGSLEIMEENNYYPFGLTHKNYNATKSDYGENGEGIRLNPLCSTCDGTYKYKYNGKELQDELGLNMYDYGARNYDPALGRWMNIDPLADTSRRWSPYTYCYNNPLRFIDPDGMQADDWRTADGKHKVYDEKKGEYTKYATSDDKKFGEALRNSGTEGANQFSQLVNSETKISVTFHEGQDREGLEYHFGETTFGNNGDGVTYKENGDVDKVVTANIDIFKGTSERFVKDVKDGSANLSLASNRQIDDAKLVKDNNLSADNVTTATLGHEIEHTTKNNRQVNVEERRGVKNADKERTPQKVNNTILKDISNKK